jgi:UDP-3-O-[3-hydroxymyristoyl] glucosamine N-acyltransferase
MSRLTLAELASRFGLEQVGDGAIGIDGVCTLTPGKPGHLAFLSNPKLRPQLAQTQAAAVIVGKRDAAGIRAGLVAADPYFAYARIAALFDRYREFTPGRHPSAVIAADATVGEGCAIGAHAVIEAGARIGAHCYVGPACVVSRDVQIGDHCRLEARVWIGPGVRIGKRADIQPGAVVGSRGFGNAPTPQGWVSVPQLGGVVIGDDVEIGSNTTIDRGALDDTVIGDGVKLDNQIQIAHNVRIGAHTAIAACVGIAGSARVGSRCMIGGAVGIGGHLVVADGTVVMAGTAVTKSLPRGVYGSIMPVMDHRHWRRTVAHTRRLETYVERIKALEKKLDLSQPPDEAPGEDDV